jgi:hypothetical protein
VGKNGLNLALSHYNEVLTPVEFRANYDIVAVPGVLLDGLAHDHFGLTTSIATYSQLSTDSKTTKAFPTNLSAVSKKLIPQS